MKKKLKETAWLGFPWLAVIGGFFIPCRIVAAIVWIASLAMMAFNLKRHISLYDENEEKSDCEEKSQALINLLLFSNLYILGCVAIPFALAGVILWGIKWCIVQLWTKTSSIIRKYQEGLKCLFVPILLYSSIWGLPLCFALLPDWKTKLIAISINLLILSYAGYLSVKLVLKHKNKTKYLVGNAVILLLSISAAIAGLLHPQWISLECFGILLFLWAFETFFWTMVIGLVTYLILTIIIMFKK